MAPAKAPTGPSASAPDKAPSAASPVRSWAIAAEDISAKEIVTIAIVFFIQIPRMGAIKFLDRPSLCLCGENIAPLITLEVGLFLTESELQVRPVAQSVGSR